MADLHVSEITLRVGLDDNRVPERLSWSAQDGGIDNEEARSTLLSKHLCYWVKNFIPALMAIGKLFSFGGIGQE